MTLLLAGFGLLADATSYRTGFLIAGLTMLLAAAAFLALGRRGQP